MKISENQVGRNRTGIDMSPIDSKEMIEGIMKFCVHEVARSQSIAEHRIRYMRESFSIGSVPVPGAKKLQGINAEVIINKLGQRLAFERTGTRLYDALITKHQGTESPPPWIPLPTLQQFRNEEAEHFAIVDDVMRELGADPTAQTPGADLSGVTAIGMIQVLTDPRTTLVQCLDAILIAELADNDGWEMLIQLCRSSGLDSAADRFQVALQQEVRHLQEVRGWILKSTALDAGVPAAGRAA